VSVNYNTVVWGNEYHVAGTPGYPKTKSTCGGALIAILQQLAWTLETRMAFARIVISIHTCWLGFIFDYAKGEKKGRV
jgi:hypothetical protein